MKLRFGIDILKRINPIVFIVLIALILRFWNFDGRIVLVGDASRDVVVAIEGAKQMQLPLLGPFSSAGPFTFGPWYFWFLIIGQVIFNQFLTPWIFVGVVSTLFVWIMYLIGKSLRDRTFGLVLALLAAVLPSQIQTATSVTNPNLIPLFSALLIFFVLKKHNDEKWLKGKGYLLVGVALGLGINLHIQMFGFAIVPLILLWKKDVRKIVKILLLISSGVLLTFIPYLAFELNSHWFNLHNLLKFVQHGHENIYLPNSWKIYLFNFWPGFLSESWGVKAPFGFIFALLAGASILYGIVKRKLLIFELFLIGVFLINIVFLRYWEGERFFGYLYYLQPIIIAVIGVPIYLFLKHKKTWFFAYAYLFLLLGLLVPQLLSTLKPNQDTAVLRTTVSTLKQTFPDQKFNVFFCQRYYGDNTNAMVLLLTEQDLLSDDGIKIAFPSGKCLVERPQINAGAAKAPVWVEATKIGTELVLADRGLSYLGYMNKEQLLENNWTSVNTKKIFDDVTRWWINDKALK